MSRTTFFKHKSKRQRTHAGSSSNVSGPANDFPGADADTTDEEELCTTGLAMSPESDAVEDRESPTKGDTSSFGSSSDQSLTSDVETANSSDENKDRSPDPVVQDSARCNEVLMPVSQFIENIDDFALYTCLVQHDVKLAAVKDILQLGACTAKYRTPHLIDKFAAVSVNLHVRLVATCVNGCVAFTHTRAAGTSSEYCGKLRFKSNQSPAQQTTYWSRTAWLVNTLSDPSLGPEMTSIMRRARIAAWQPVDGVQDWYDGSTFRSAVRDGHFTSDTDVAVIAWNGAGYVYPIRVFVVNVRGGSRSWETVGFIPHIPKAAGNGKNARWRQAVSDSRNDLLQRCLALVLRRFIHASEHGLREMLPRHGSVLLVPRVVGLVFDQVQERETLGFMGHQSTFNCSHCLVRRDESCYFGGLESPRRPVISTLEAQLTATQSRAAGGRPRVRAGLASSMSALPFVPALGAVHGLGTGAARLYDIVSFDTLHVWKLSLLRTLAQGLPSMLEAVCDGEPAMAGSVQNTLDAVNVRSFGLGRLCRASPTTPGYVIPLLDTPTLWGLRERGESHILERIHLTARLLCRPKRLLLSSLVLGFYSFSAGRSSPARSSNRR